MIIYRFTHKPQQSRIDDILAIIDTTITDEAHVIFMDDDDAYCTGCKVGFDPQKEDHKCQT